MNNYYNLLFKLLIIILLTWIFTNKKIFNTFVKIIHFSNESNSLKIASFREMFNCTTKKETILIFEPNIFHHECTPGYSKYFIDLGYNVDILMYPFGIDSLKFFEKNNKIKIFIFHDLNEIEMNSKILSTIIQKYSFILLQTTSSYEMKVFQALNLLKLNNSFFVFHDLEFINILNYSNYLNENRIWTLGNFSIGLQINPNYFGNIKIRNKNKDTIFFMTSSERRNYTDLISSFIKLKRQNFFFKLIVTGRSKNFFSKVFPREIIDNFLLMYNVNYSSLYRFVELSDYIIIPLNSNNTYDHEYNYRKSSGSIQLVYGFLKPAIINSDFSHVYQLNEKNSLLYNNINMFDILKKAIILQINQNY